ncbi:hypothetical protein K435DRAFT_609701, partial [Dendrothele bispora CBS 962.96]
PECSHNTKAQSCHHAKHKAYIKQLQQTITKLQTTLGFTSDQVSALPPPLTKIHELELKQKDAHLIKENGELCHVSK